MMPGQPTGLDPYILYCPQSAFHRCCQPLSEHNTPNTLCSELNLACGTLHTMTHCLSQMNKLLHALRGYCLPVLNDLISVSNIDTAGISNQRRRQSISPYLFQLVIKLPSGSIWKAGLLVFNPMLMLFTVTDNDMLHWWLILCFK